MGCIVNLFQVVIRKGTWRIGENCRNGRARSTRHTSWPAKSHIVKDMGCEPPSSSGSHSSISMPSVDTLGACALAGPLPTILLFPVGADARGKGVSMPIARAPSFNLMVSAERLGGAFWHDVLGTTY